MNSILWAFLGSVLILGGETAFRRGSLTWEGGWWLVIPLALAVNYTVYKTITTGYTYLGAVIFFSLFNAMGRVLISPLVLHEPLKEGNLVAAMALLIGATVSSIWR